MKYQDKISARGAGGGGKSGGGSGRAAVEAPDSLRSRQYARVLDLLCEGEIEGLVDGLKSVYLDDTPIQNPDGSYNFTGVTFDSRNGTQDQTYIPGFNTVESENPAGLEVKSASPVTRSISDTNLDAVRITVGIPQLTEQSITTGDLNGASVRVAIDVQNNGGGFVAQPIRNIFSSANFAIISGSQARGYVESTRYIINTSWSGQQLMVYQTCSVQLQYREVGDATWISYQNYTFSGKGLNGGWVGGIGGGYTAIAPTAQHTFNVALPEAMYEFRLVKTAGSAGPYGTGAAYGGTAFFTSGQIYQPEYFDTISGKTTTRYQRDYRIELPAPGPWDIRVRRITADSTTQALQNKTFWDSYTEIIDSKLSYPNSVLAGLQVRADQFTSIPRRGYLIRGLKVKIPSNYDPLLRTYDGAWDGTFVTAWTNNPAWCLYDLITNTRYGLGEYIDASQVDKWSLYNIAQYCDELVDDGFGGLEPRFTLNVYLQTAEDAYTLISNLASVFRAMSYWSAGSVTTVQDAPSDPVALFTAANIIDGVFNYSGSSAKTRHTVVLVSWNDPGDNYRQKIEYVEDTEAIARYGIIKSEVVALGCTSRGQAHRLGRAIIYTEQMESETITFRAGLDGTVCYPGAVIKVQDQFRSGVRFGGRLRNATVDEIELDAAVTLEAGKVYTLSCVLPDGSIEDRTITDPAGEHTLLHIAESFSVAPQDWAIWVISTNTLQTTQWRVLSVSEPEKAQVEITALAYRPDKYAAIEEGLVLEPINYSNIRANPDPVSGLSVTETLTLVGLNLVGVKVTVSWNTTPTASRYVVRYNREDGNLIELETANNTIDIQPVEEGTYEFSVVAINSIGRRSQPTTISQIIYGKTVPPVDVENFSVIKIGGEARAAWTLHPDLDVQVGGLIVVRHSPLTEGATWQDGIIYEAFPGSAINGVVPLTTGTYMAKAQDSSGNWSENMVSFVATEGMVTGWTTVGSTVQNPEFDGSKVNVIDTDNQLKLVGGLPIDDWLQNIDDLGSIDAVGGIVSSGSYEFDEILDLGTVATRRFEASIEALSYDIDDAIDYKDDLIDAWGPIDGDAINDCDVTLYASTTDDDPSASPTWGPYSPFFVADYTCRAARFRLDFESGSPNHNISVSTLSVAAKVPA